MREHYINMTDPELALLFRAKRMESGLTLRRTANMLGVTYSWLSQVERSKKPMGATMRCLLIDFLDARHSRDVALERRLDILEARLL